MNIQQHFFHFFRTKPIPYSIPLFKNTGKAIQSTAVHSAHHPSKEFNTNLNPMLYLKMKQLTYAILLPTLTCIAVLLLLLLATIAEQHLANHLVSTHEILSDHVSSLASYYNPPTHSQTPAPPPDLGLSTEAHLIQAAKDGNLTTVQRALDRMQIHDSHRHAVVDMALYYSAEFDHVDIVSHLLSREGVDPNEAHHQDGHTALTIACSKGHADVVQLLILTRGSTINFNLKAKRGKTALIWASINGHDRVVQLLTGKKHRVHLELRDNHYKRTALMWATANHHTAVVDTLLRAGANPHTKGAKNPFLKRKHRVQPHVNAMHIAKHYKHHEAVKHLDRHIQARTHTVPMSQEHAEELDELRRSTLGPKKTKEEEAEAAAEAAAAEKEKGGMEL